MKTRITLIEYLNYTSAERATIGHGKKVLQQMAELLSEEYTVECMCSALYLPDGFTQARQTLDVISQEGKTIKEINSAVFRNLRACGGHLPESEIIWFTNSDWHLMAFLPFLRTRAKIVVTAYRDIRKDVATSKSKLAFLKKALVEKGIKKTDLFAVSNRNLQLSNNQVFIPDYFFDETYESYLSETKIDRVLCVGAMRKSKDLDGLIARFRESDVPVYIVGGFQDKDWLKQLKKQSTSNIRIEDRIVPYDEYYHLIGESRFTIMPYNMDIYETATSGILQEAIFLGSVPIAPEKLLQYNCVRGIGYHAVSELPNSLDALKKLSKSVDNCLEEYKKNTQRKKIESAVSLLLGDNG